MIAVKKHILIVRLSSIGDVLHATAVAHTLKKIFPDCRLSWLASPPASELLKNNPDIDKLIIWDRRPFDRYVSEKKFIAAAKELKKARAVLKSEKFDITLDIQGLFLTGLLTAMSSAKKRIGIRERHEGGALFMTEVAPDTESIHKIHRYLTALLPLGAKNFCTRTMLRVTDGQKKSAREFLAARGIDETRPILMVNIRTTWSDKNYAPEKFGAVLSCVPQNVQTVFCGAAADREYIDRARKTLPLSFSVAGETDLVGLAALFCFSTLLVTCDTGPLYIAEAVGLPTLSLWGPTTPAMYGPLSEGHSFILTENECAACNKTRCRFGTNACMEAIEPAVVAKKLLELLEKYSAKNLS